MNTKYKLWNCKCDCKVKSIPAKGGCTHFTVSLSWFIWPCWRRWRTVYVLTVSFYSWELRTCYLFKVDVSTMHICITPPYLVVLVPAESLWAVLSDDASTRATCSYPSSHCQAERLCSQLCETMTGREEETQRELLQPDTAVFFNYSETSGSCYPCVLQYKL